MPSKLGYLESPLKTLWFAVSRHKWKLFAMSVFIICGNMFQASLSYFFKHIADKVTQSQGAVSFAELWGPFASVALVLVALEISYRIGHLFEIHIAPDAFRDITISLYEGLIKRPTSYFEDKFSGDLGRRIEQVGAATLYFTDSFLWTAGWIFTTTCVTGILLSTTHPYMFFTFLAWFFLFFGVSIPLLRRHYRLSEEVAEAHAKLAGNVVDALANIPLIHTFGGVAQEQKRNEETVAELITLERKRRWNSILNKFQQGWSIVFLGISLTFMSVFLFTREEFTIGDFVIVVGVIPPLIGVMWNFGDWVIESSKQYGHLSNAVMHLREKQEQLIGGKIEATKKQYPVTFEKLSFKYPGTKKPVFRNFSLKIAQGEHVGIVGPSGAGKSTLIKLLLRQYEPQGGVISIAGTPIEKLSLPAFNNLISYVPQDTSLFHRTLLENIQYANPLASKEALLEASKHAHAHAHEFITALPEQYETKVGERGIKLSGGQRQRIALSRAILKNAPVLVLDEATSSLDSESESVVQEALAELFRNRTVIAIAHRLSTLRAMDRIVVMEKGKITESGTPQELLKRKNSTFKRMWEHQRNGFI